MKKRLQHTAEEIDANLSEVHNSKGSCSCLSERLASMDETIAGKANASDLAAKANASDLAAKANASDVAALQTQITTPFNFKGTVASASDLPSTAELNDTYFVTELNYRVTWNGTEFTQSSLDEGEYEDELSEISEDVDSVKADLSEYIGVKNLLNLTTTISKTPYGFIEKNFAANEKLKYKLTYSGDNYSDNNVLFYRSDGTTATATKCIPDEWVEFTPQEDFVKVRIYVNLTEAEAGETVTFEIKTFGSIDKN